MSKKDFSQFLQNPQNFTDYEPKIESENLGLPIKNLSFQPNFAFLSLKLLLSTGVLSLLTAPLTTSYISLQLSINPQKFPQDSKNLIPSIISKLKSQIKSPELLTKYSLLLENNLKNSNRLPFKPMKFANYPEVFRELSTQGFKGLYKGNLCGILYHWLGTTLKLKGAFYFEEKTMKKNAFSKEIILFSLYTLIDMALHPIQTLQTRLILQNANKKLALYKNSFEFFKDGFKNKRIFFQGVFLHIPKNLLIILLLNLKIKNFDKNQAFILNNLLANIIVYPIMTIMRRMMCQDDGKPWMLERHYKNSWNALMKIRKEEGAFKGCFKGFSGFFVVSSFMLALNFTYQENINY